MIPTTSTYNNILHATWRDYLALCKLRVVALMILTTIVGMCLASPHFISLYTLFFGNLGIALSAAAAAVINHIVDQHIDQRMQRTERRPIAQGKISTRSALYFAIFLCTLGMLVLINFVNGLTAFLTFLTVIGYAGLYSLYLKHATPQNIVIGGIAGAAPPLLGWTAITNQINAPALLLVLIIFVWTPPHFWSLAIYRFDDYAKAKVPMLPNTHGIHYTKISILLYTILLAAITLLPFAISMSGWIYLFGVSILNSYFIYLAIKLLKTKHEKLALVTFRYSIIYLMLLFLILLIDHYF